MSCIAFDFVGKITKLCHAHLWSTKVGMRKQLCQYCLHKNEVILWLQKESEKGGLHPEGYFNSFNLNVETSIKMDRTF